MANLWVRTTVNNRATYECQCSDVGLWASGLRQAGIVVNLVTSYPALPSGTRTVDVEYPGFGTIRGVPVVGMEDAARNAGPAERADTGRWTYELDDLPYRVGRPGGWLKGGEGMVPRYTLGLWLERRGGTRSAVQGPPEGDQ